MRTYLAVAAIASPLSLALAQPALAAPKPGDPVKVAEGLMLDPIVEGRLRWEHVDQPATDADAVTVRLRAGVELKHASGLSLLAEGEGTLGIVKDYNAFPFAIADRQRRPQFSTVADGESIDLNRLQIQYKAKDLSLTVGRQRINLDDQRFVGSVAWRQNEQTFDAVRAEAKLGPVALDATYAIAQRTVFGSEAGPRTHYDGDFVFAGTTVKLGPVNLKGFAYLLDYDPAFAFAVANSSQTYGARATASLPLAKATKLNLVASYARQSDWGSNPADYAADYVLAEAAVAHKALTLTAGYELLGADAGAGRSVQTPMATLHKFNGWADMFLTTPAAGLRDAYLGAAYRFEGVKALPGLNAAVVWHDFRSDTGSIAYGNEWNASLGFKLGRVGVLAKYANYDAKGFGVDTEKLWIQFEFAY